MNKIYHVELHEPLNGQRHFYFGSKSAIYGENSPLAAEDIGIAQQSLANLKIRGEPYVNKKCTIRFGMVVRSQGLRGRKQSE